jgi:hypothetical protein
MIVLLEWTDYRFSNEKQERILIVGKPDRTEEEDVVA